MEIELPEFENDEYEKEALAKKREIRHKMQKRRLLMERIVLIVCILLVILVSSVIGVSINNAKRAKREEAQRIEQARLALKEKTLYDAAFLADGYDYDNAIAKIKGFAGYEEDAEMLNKIAEIEQKKATVKRFENVNSITHVFFHTLICDTSLAFDGDYKEAGYNQYMTTVSEFSKMLEEMYKRNYVLVDIHDIAKKELQPDGTYKFVPGDIYLPEGKIPFVMSQDDVSYYTYMQGDGFATKLVIGSDGFPTCEYVKKDGSVVYGDYDLVPILERFIRNHPDFSYKGARAALAITGYNGVLGYRTCPSEDGYNPDDVEKAKKVAQRMVECGWTFASHTWGHQKYGNISYEKMVTDAQKWNDEVKPILGDVDVLIYANGYDIAGVESYFGAKYEFLKSLGFDYFCNVDSSKAWVQIKDGYVRQGRRNLDGYRMWYSPKRLDDLFNVADVWDNTRPTPVPPI